MPTNELFLRDVIDIKGDVHADDFKVELSGDSPRAPPGSANTWSPTS